MRGKIGVLAFIILLGVVSVYALDSQRSRDNSHAISVIERSENLATDDEDINAPSGYSTSRPAVAGRATGKNHLWDELDNPFIGGWAEKRVSDQSRIYSAPDGAAVCMGSVTSLSDDNLSKEVVFSETDELARKLAYDGVRGALEENGQQHMLDRVSIDTREVSLSKPKDGQWSSIIFVATKLGGRVIVNALVSEFVRNDNRLSIQCSLQNPRLKNKIVRLLKRVNWR